MGTEALTVGELARRAGLTVRALHHYDEIGLVRPSRRGESGYRLYSARDVARLQQVLALRRLGFRLDEIRDCLDRPDISLRNLVVAQIEQLRQRITREQDLCRRLEAMRDRLDAADLVSVEEILQTIEVMTMIEEYYTPEQRDFLNERRALLGEERMGQVPGDWERLMTEVRTEQERGTDPLDPRVLDLARRWTALVHEFTGGDAGISQSVGRLWNEQADKLLEEHPMENDPRVLMTYLGPALQAVQGTA